MENKICGTTDIELTQKGHEQAGDKIYILVAHNGIARIVESYFREMDNEEFSSFGIKNCEVKRYDFNDNAKD